LAEHVARSRPDIGGQLVALEQRAGRRRRNRVAGGVAVTAAVVAAVVWVPGIAGRLPSTQPASGDTSLSVLDTRVPITPGLSTMLDAGLAHPGQVSRIARLAEVEPTANIWQEAYVAETSDRRLCLWVIEEGLTYLRGSVLVIGGNRRSGRGTGHLLTSAIICACGAAPGDSRERMRPLVAMAGQSCYESVYRWCTRSLPRSR
jgi:hypothetical protein